MEERQQATINAMIQQMHEQNAKREAELQAMVREKDKQLA